MTKREETKAVVQTSAAAVGPPQEKHYDQFRNALVARKEEFAAALVGWMKADHFIEVVTSAYLSNPKLWQANPITLYQACRRAALLNLRPDGEEGYLEVYYDSKAREDRVAFQPMYKGLVRTLTRGGTVLHVDPQVVRSGDFFEYQLGDSPFVRHVPEKDPEKRGDITYAYAIFHLANGLKHREVMSREEMDDIRANAKKRRPEGPAWTTNPDQMYRKMPVKRGSKFLDLTPRQAAVIRYDDELESGHAREPAEDIPEVEYRTLDQRAEDAAKRNVDALREGMERLSAKTIADQRVGFGAHREQTWGELAEKQRGYITHYVLTDDDCPWVDDDTKSALRSWLGVEEEEEEPAVDPKAIIELHDRGLEAIRELTEHGLEEEKAEGFRADVGMLHDDGSFFELQDVVDELERRVGEARASASGDLFGGGS